MAVNPDILKAKLKVYYENLNLYTSEKYYELLIKMALESYDIIIFTAIRRDDNAKLNVNIDGYKVLFSPIAQQHHGIAVYVKSCYDVEINKHSIYKYLRESLWIELTEGTNKLLVGVIYRNIHLPPHFRRGWLKNLHEALGHMKHERENYITQIIVGNFNLPTLRWQHGKVVNKIDFHNCQNFLYSFMHMMYHSVVPYQNVDFNTFHRDGLLGTDCLVFTDPDVKLDDIAAGPPLDYNHNFSITFTIPNTQIFYFKRKKTPHGKVSYVAIGQTLQDEAWLKKLKDANIEQAFTMFRETILGLERKKVGSSCTQTLDVNPLRLKQIALLSNTNLYNEKLQSVNHQSICRSIEGDENENLKSVNKSSFFGLTQEDSYKQTKSFKGHSSFDLLQHECKMSGSNTNLHDIKRPRSIYSSSDIGSTREECAKLSDKPTTKVDDGNNVEMNKRETVLAVTADEDIGVPKWASKHAVNAVRQKISNWKKPNYRESCSNTKRDIATSYKDHQLVTEENVREFINKNKSQNDVDSFIDENDRHITNPKKMAEMLSDYFYSMFTNEDNSSKPYFEPIEHVDPLSNLIIDEEDVLDQITLLSEKKNAGPDDIPPGLLVHLEKWIVKPLQIIFQKSLNEGAVPALWKDAKIQPKFKQGDPQRVSNYRPLSITSIVCKMLERIVKMKLGQHLEKFHLQSIWQHGHKNKRSAITNIMETVHCWMDYLSHDIPVDVLYMDFQKAFDSVPHQRLFNKLQQYNITGNLFAWFKSFLTGRRQRVSFKKADSSWRNMVSGVAQGTVLSGLLFMIYVNDVPALVKNRVAMYTDDIKVYAPQGPHYLPLQIDLDALHAWSKAMQLPFNMAKCKVMHLGTNNPRHMYSYVDKYGTIKYLDTTDLQRDLGVMIDSQLTFNAQVEHKATETEEHMTIIFDAIKVLDLKTFKLIYQTDIRSKLLYACPVWFPNHKKDEDRLERVQEEATRRVKDLKNMSYENRLKALELPTVKHFMLTEALVQIYRILTGSLI